MSGSINMIPYILIGLAVCFLTRLLPFVVFKDESAVPPIIMYIGKYLPPAVITGIVVYCLKDTAFTVFPYGAKELSSVALVTGLHLWKRNTLISVFSGTAFYMFLVQFF